MPRTVARNPRPYTRCQSCGTGYPGARRAARCKSCEVGQQTLWPLAAAPPTFVPVAQADSRPRRRRRRGNRG